MSEQTDQVEETILKTVMGDYWKSGLLASQTSGTYTVTSRSIRFKGGMGATVLELPYSDIISAARCNVGSPIKFLPTGIMVAMKDGKTHRLSLMKRKEFLNFIQSKL